MLGGEIIIQRAVFQICYACSHFLKMVMYSIVVCLIDYTLLQVAMVEEEEAEEEVGTEVEVVVVAMEVVVDEMKMVRVDTNWGQR